MEEWKNVRAEQEMQEAGKKMMQEAAERKQKEEDLKWDEVRSDLYRGDSEEADWVINRLRERYQLPIKK